MDMIAVVPKRLTPMLGRLKVLVIDDEPHMRKVVRTMLTSCGVKNVREAHDGPSGLAELRNHAPDLVLVDWEMPGIDGRQFTQLVRMPGAVPHPDVPIIMLTGHSERWRVEEAARLGVREYLLKPVSTQALLERIVAAVTLPREPVSAPDHFGEARPASVNAVFLR